MVKGKLKILIPKQKIIDAILASSSFPGMLSPYEISKKLYSDGGILNHFPTDILQGRCDYLIGVYVSPIQNIESKDLKSIKSITSRAFDLLYANYNYQNSICAIGLSNQRNWPIIVRLKPVKLRWIPFLKLDTTKQKKIVSGIKFIIIQNIFSRKNRFNYICTKIIQHDEVQKNSF